MRLATIAWRSLAARPLRTALATVGIALGVASVAATVVTGASAEAAVRSAASELLGRAEIRLRAFDETGFTPRALQAVRAIDGVVAVAPVSERRITVGAEPNRVFSMLVLGIDPRADAAIRDLDLAAGVGLAQDSPSDALVGARWAAGAGLGIGDELLPSGDLPDRPPLRIVGLLDETGLGALEEGEVLVVTRAALDAAFAVPAPLRYLDLDVREGRVGEVSAALDATLDEPFVVETVADAGARLGAAQAGFATLAFLFGLVALVVGAFLVGTTLAMTVAERTREIALLRAAGTTARQVRGLVIRQGVVLGITGTVAGLLGGIGLAMGMVAALQATRSMLVDGLRLPPVGLALAAALGIAVTLAGATIPASRAAAITPLEAMRPTQAGGGLLDRLRWLIGAEVAIVVVGTLVLPRGGGLPLVPVILSFALLLGGALAAALLVEPLSRIVGRPFEWFFGAEGMLGRANLTRDRARSGLTAGALMIALAAVVALGTVAESARAGANAQVASILPGGHAIRLGVAVDVDQLRPTLEATIGLRAASPIVELPAVVRDGEQQREVSLAGIDPNVFADNGALLITGADRTDAFDALRSGGAVLVPGDMARREGIVTGQLLELARPGQEARSFIVAGNLEYTLPARTPDGALLVSLADARDTFGATTTALWAMVPQPDVDDAAFASAVRETALSLGGEAVTVDVLAGDLSRSLERLVGLLDVLALVAVVIGALGIVNTLSMGVSERVREIAILRSHGMTTTQVQAMVVAEASMIGAIAGLLAVVAGVAVAWALVGGGSAGDFAAGFQLPWSLLAATILAGTGVAALAGLYPARVAARLPVVRHLKQFE